MTSLQKMADCLIGHFFCPFFILPATRVFVVISSDQFPRLACARCGSEVRLIT